MPKISFQPFALAVLLGLCAAPLFGRDVVVTVSDADLGIPLEGAVIRSWDGEEYVCDEDGKAAVAVPDDRQVVIRIAYPGYENGRLLIPVSGNEFSGALRLGGIMENRELVIEAASPEASEARSGRSIAISGETLSRTAEIGFIEDVMTSIKLLPGVGYSGMFDAQPSIRGGAPGDLMAALDGFYIDNPYHWGGAYSIFVPQMVESAKLSHGVFSSRYGHTISGLLEIVSRKPSPTETQFDLGVSTSETNLGLSFPLAGKGGVAVMGKVTYWDPLVWGAQQISKGVPELEMINSVTTAPYIRDFSITGNYRFSTDLELTATGFLGSDGVGANYHNEYERDDEKRKVDLIFDWMNYRLFGIAGITWSPHRDMVFRASAGAGLYETDMIADVTLELPREPDYMPPLPVLPGGPDEDEEGPVFWDYLKSMNLNGTMTSKTITYQGRADFDWGFREGFIFAAGAQELYSQWIEAEDFKRGYEWVVRPPDNSDFDAVPYDLVRDVKNQGISSSVYSLLEYLGPGQKFGAELGLRVDHFYFIGKDFTIQTMPVLNPRINLDFGILKNRGSIDALTLTVGTGLFSSMNDAISSIDVSNNIDNFDLKPNRSWTSIVGTKIDFAEKFSFNIEAYYKYIFNRAYTVDTTYEGDSDNPDVKTKIDYWFNGSGRVVGFDFILQKLESRYWDGWLSYSFTWAQYRNQDTIPDPIPNGVNPERYPKTGNDWFYPYFHRYHNINLVLNFKPSRSFNIGTRFGFASGTPKNDENSERTGFSWPVDVKFSFFRFNPKGKVNTEIYLGIENLQALVYDAIWIARVNGYTGEEEPSEYKPVYDLPIPMVSFGFKWRY
ncbi:hypothetical protein LQZ19_13770 [Treponema primitia]|uniref:TonB-dependent receptor plug domain-containing protein n=1 Tax=Treponema primitia TaxID=88058 RepID=UPI00397F5FF6